MSNGVKQMRVEFLSIKCIISTARTIYIWYEIYDYMFLIYIYMYFHHLHNYYIIIFNYYIWQKVGVGI